MPQERAPLEDDHEGQQEQRQRHDPEQGGTAATSVEIWAVTATSSPDGTKDSATQPSVVRAGMAAAGASRAPARRAASRAEPMAEPAQRQSRPAAARIPRSSHGPAHASGSRRLDHEGISDQRQKAADIRGGIEEIGIVRVGVPGPCEPGLQQRAVGRRQRRTAARPRRRTARSARGTSPLLRAGARSPTASPIGRLTSRTIAIRAIWISAARRTLKRLTSDMRVAVAGEQHGLEEHHRDRPDAGRAAELRQHHLGEHRLNAEQQKGGKEDRRSIKTGSVAASGGPEIGRLV